MSDPRDDDRRNAKGSVMVVAALALVALVLFAALAIDVGFAWSSRTQSQNVSDSAALAAASTMISQVGIAPATVEITAAMTEGGNYASSNSTVANPSAVVREVDGPGGDFEFGWWDVDTRTLDTTVDKTDPDFVTGVRVNLLMDDAGDTNKRSPTFLSQLLGRDGFDVKNTAVAYLGFEGEWDPAEFDLPIAIDSCKIAAHSGGDPGCDDERCGCNFCSIAANPLNTCPLEWDQGPSNVTCLNFSNTADQNSCWTLFDGNNSSVNSNDLEDMVDSGNPGDVGAGDDVFLDNGEKQSVTKHLRNLFYGCNNNGQNCNQPSAKGEDRYAPNPAGSPGTAPEIDSWVVKLPVVDCVPGAHCASGDTQEIIGGVCFQIREILASAGDYAHPTEHTIKGRFLCPDSGDPEVQLLFDTYCRDSSTGSAPGGCNFGFRAQRPVLVE